MSASVGPRTDGERADEQTEAEAAPAAPRRILDLGGEYTNGLDGKGRVVLPAPHRWAFEDGGRLLPWQGECIAALPEVAYRAHVLDVHRQLLQASAVGEPVEVIRELRRSAFEIRLDIQGRLTLPEEMRRLAGIDDEVRFVGNGSRVELWPAVDSTDRAEARADHRATIALLQRAYDDVHLLEG